MRGKQRIFLLQAHHLSPVMPPVVVHVVGSNSEESVVLIVGLSMPLPVARPLHQCGIPSFDESNRELESCKKIYRAYTLVSVDADDAHVAGGSVPIFMVTIPEITQHRRRLCVKISKSSGGNGY